MNRRVASSLFALTLGLATISSLAQDAPTVQLKIAEPQTPIVIASSGEPRATLLQTLDLSSLASAPSEIVVDLSDPKYLLGLEARIGDKVVGDYEFRGIFNVDYNTPTMPTQVPIQIDAKTASEALAKTKDLEIWTKPSEFAAPDLKIKVGIRSLTTDGGKIKFAASPLEYRFGVLVRDSGWDGVAQYRIPGIVRSVKGTLIAVYDARHNGFPDLPADIDVACSRSFDNGKTWEPMQIVVDVKGDDETKEGAGDPAILVDEKTGRIWVACLWAHNGKTISNSEPGLELGKSGRLVLSYSDDDGETWSEPRDITNEAAPDKDWRLYFQGPGSGIATRDGKLVFPAQFFDKDKTGWSTIVWSADGGETWKVGTGARKGTCESQVVELTDGRLMLNMRNYRVDLRERSVATTSDLGATWTEFKGEKLPCPICQASIIRVRSKANGDDSDLLAFMNPNSPNSRTDMTIKLSEDEGKTWSRSITIYRPGCCGYSSLVKIDSDTIGAFYETLGGLIYQTVKIDDIR